MSVLSHADDFSKSFSAGDQTITLKISDSAWRHITVGNLNHATYEGGHDWTLYKERALSTQSKIFFDTHLNAFVVESEKGDNLDAILTNLRNKQSVSYHTLFPQGVLTKEFVFDAFKAAYSLNRISQIKTGRDSHMDFRRGLFYVETGGFKVAGYFTGAGHTFSITSIFPDLTWHYRIDFLHHRDDEFLSSRFLAYNAETEIWERHGAAFTPTSPANQFWPQPWVSLSEERAVGRAGQTMCSDLFVAFDTLTAHFKEFQFAGDTHVIHNVFAYFFDDPANPTRKELELLGNFIKTVIYDFKLKPKRISSLAMIINEFERIFRIKNNQVHFLCHYARSEDGLFLSVTDYAVPRKADNSHYLATMIMHQILAYHVGSFFKPAGKQVDDWLYDLGNKYHRNLQAALFSEEMIAMMAHHQLVVSMSLTHEARTPHILTLFSIANISATSLLGQEQKYRMVAAIRGNDDFDKISFMSVMAKVLSKKKS